MWMETLSYKERHDKTGCREQLRTQRRSLISCFRHCVPWTLIDSFFFQTLTSHFTHLAFYMSWRRQVHIGEPLVLRLTVQQCVTFHAIYAIFITVTMVIVYACNVYVCAYIHFHSFLFFLFCCGSVSRSLIGSRNHAMSNQGYLRETMNCAG